MNRHNLSHWWTPHVHSIYSDPVVLTLSCTGSFLTATACLVIALQLFDAAWFFWGIIPEDIKDLIIHAGLFIFANGVANLFHIWVWWNPDYMLQGWATLIKGIIAMAFVIRLQNVIKHYKVTLWPTSQKPEN